MLFQSGNLSQIIGFIAFAFALIAYHRKKKKKILGNMVISNILNLFHYLLLEAYSGCITKVLAIIRDCFIIISNTKLFLIFYSIYITLIVL